MTLIKQARTTPRTAAGIAVAVAVTGLGSAVGTAPARSATSSECPATYPVAQLQRGQAVTGRTVVAGTTPIGLTGEVIGVLDDGIAPGLDLVMVDLAGNPSVDEAGIWAGMSGSPIYDATDGRIIGAVGYGLALGSSPVAGVTPAGQMRKLLDSPPAHTTAPAESIDVTDTQARRIARTTAATQRQAAAGFERLAVPFGVSGLGAARLRRAVKAFGFDGSQVYRAGAAAAPTTAADPGQIVAGGNLAASASYGDVTSAGVGTATMVCGTEVLAFGHPAFYTGPSSMTMHAADALYIQRDAFVSFKVANVSGPVGGFDRDRLAGLHGVLGSASVPETTTITSAVRMGGRQRTGTTRVSVPDAVPDIAATHLLVDHDRVFDRVGGGSGLVTWKVEGRRADGSPFSFSRTNRYADRQDLTFVPSLSLYSQLSRVHDNGFEDARITRIRTSSVLSGTYRRWHIQQVRARQFGRWSAVGRQRPILARPGGTMRLKVTLGSFRDKDGKRDVILRVPVPKHGGGKPARLNVSGGDSGLGDLFEEELFGPAGPRARSFGELLGQLRNGPRHDQLRAELSVLRPMTGAVTVRRDRRQLGAVVGGNRNIRVVMVRPTRR